MTNTTTKERPVLLADAMKRAVSLVRELGLQDPDTDRPLQVTRENWRTILEDHGHEVPDVITGWDDDRKQFIINGVKANGSTPRVRVQSEAVPNRDDDGKTITCTGPCGQTMPLNKFPTLKKGGRGSVCRACEAAGRAARKAAAGR